MSNVEWKDVGGLEKLDIIAELEDVANNAMDTANAGVRGPSESNSLAYYAECIRAAIRKLKE